MRIAIIDPSLFTLPYDDHLCRALFERGNSVTLFTRPLRDDEHHLAFDYWKSEHFYRVAESRRLRRLPSRARSMLKGLEHTVEMATCLRELNLIKPDVIHFQWIPVPLLDRLYTPLLRRIAPIFLTVHDSGGFLSPSSRLQLAGWSSLLDSVDQLIVHLEASKRALVERGLSPERITVIPHGVLALDDGDAREDEAPIDRPGPERSILLFGTIKHYKGTDILLRAFALLPEELRRTATVRVVGQPFIDIEELKSLAERLGIADRVHWETRFIPDEELGSLLRSADIFAFPYRQIDTSGVLMMVLPFERPVVATRVGCFEELLVDGETAILAEPESPESFAEALERALRDPGGARSMALRAKAWALGQMSWDQIAKETEATYSRAIARRGARRPATHDAGARPGPGRRLSGDEEPRVSADMLRCIGHITLHLAMADRRLVASERVAILDALGGLEPSLFTGVGQVKKFLGTILEEMDLTPGHLDRMLEELDAELDDPLRRPLLEALFAVATSTGRLEPATEEVLGRISARLKLPLEALEDRASALRGGSATS